MGLGKKKQENKSKEMDNQGKDSTHFWEDITVMPGWSPI